MTEDNNISCSVYTLVLQRLEDDTKKQVSFAAEQRTLFFHIPANNLTTPATGNGPELYF